MPKRKRSTAPAAPRRLNVKNQKPAKWNPAAFSPRPLVAAGLLVVFAGAGAWTLLQAQAAPLSSSGKPVPGITDTSGKPASQADTAAEATAKAGQDTKPGQVKPGQSKDKEIQKNEPASKTVAKADAKPKPKLATPTAPVPAPAPAAVPQPASAGWHDNIITSIFWAGEGADASNNHISNAPSAWDGNWATHYGGVDDPANRKGFHPAAFTPRENPFYFALPYNDLDINGNRKPTAGNCPNKGNTISWCKNAWIKISKGGKVAYAQWQDVGPLEEDDVAYVFGTARPKNTWGLRAGLDVSPAVATYLGLSGNDLTNWAFVAPGDVPAGPWRDIITSSQGGW